MFDASKFSEAVRRNYGIEIPKLAALGIAEQLASEGILEVVSGYANSTTYRYRNTVRTAGKDVSSITENDVETILILFMCQVSCDHIPIRSWPFFRARALLQAVIASFKAEQHP